MQRSSNTLAHMIKNTFNISIRQYNRKCILSQYLILYLQLGLSNYPPFIYKLIKKIFEKKSTKEIF